jgi:hypothetical protein
MSDSGYREEWKTLYSAVRQICSRYGKENSTGNGDYWVADENWGGVTQRIIVYSPAFLRPKLVRELMEYLGSHKCYGVMIEVILDLNFNGRKLPPSMGLVIDMHSAVEHWDLSVIRGLIGQGFYADT